MPPKNQPITAQISQLPSIQQWKRTSLASKTNFLYSEGATSMIVGGRATGLLQEPGPSKSRCTSERHFARFVFQAFRVWRTPVV